MIDIKEAIKSSKSKPDEEDKKMLRGNISLVLDSYEDIFSDFDPRPYTERSLSDDFLFECKKAAREKEEGVELRILMQAERRNLNNEIKIKRRLREHFTRHYHLELKKIRKIRKEGFILFFFGAILALIATYFFELHSLYSGQPKGFLYGFLIIIFETAGWFTIWTGLDRVIFDVRDKRAEFEFYKKMALAEIYFFSY